LYFTQLLFLPTRFIFGCELLCFFNGGKFSDLHSVPRSQYFSILDSHHIFNSLRVASSYGRSRLALHNIFDCTHKAHRLMNHDILIAPRCPFLMRHHIFVFITFIHRSARHDIFDFTAMPIF
jgi:hypothetical protein